MPPIAQSPPHRPLPLPRSRPLALYLGLWTLLVALVAVGLLLSVAREERGIALHRALDSYQKDLAYRRWAAERGGVYVPQDEKTPPNPYLAFLPHRDITSTDGKRLTLVNPAYMTRMVHELGNASYSLKAHLTSLRPLRPENAADPWERKALEAFERGAREYSEFLEQDGRPVLRFMGAFMVEKGCLACHAQQGYRVGQVRGGLSVTVPLHLESGRLGMGYRWLSGLVLLGFWTMGTVGILLWIRRRRLAQERDTHLIHELETSSQRFASIQATTPDGLLFVDNLGVIQWANENYCRLSGYAKEDLQGAALTLVECTDSDAVIRQRIARIHKGESQRFRTRHRAKDGRILDLEVTPASLPPGNEVIAFFRDITEDLKSQRLLSESETRFRIILESCPAPIFIHRQGRFLYANLAGASLLDAEGPKGLEGQEVMACVHPDYREQVKERILATQHDRQCTPLAEECLLSLKGREIWAAMQAVRIELDGEPATLVFALDITERRKSDEERRLLEQEVQHTQKLESLGSLAGGIAHDMNNVLGAILGLSDLLQMKHSDNESLAKSLKTIKEAACRGRDLVKGLTNFARKGLQETLEIDLNALVRSEMALLEHSTRQRFTFDLRLDENLPKMRGEASTLSSALMNLCVNAFDAMPHGGNLQITTRRETDRLLLTVKDTGEGIPPEVLPRILEPFYTTKPAGRGTGLGLAMVYGTVKAHGGTLDIQSLVGKGTCVTLCFPVAQQTDTPSPSHGVEESTAPQSLRILLVDDDALVRAVVPDMLGELGHRVQVESSALEALRRLDAGLEVDLLILDHNMPGMTGAEALPRILQRRPQLRILVATGFMDDDMKLMLAQFPGVRALLKPFAMADLRRLIGEA